MAVLPVVQAHGGVNVDVWEDLNARLAATAK
jgi:hypothetical protein